jgi:hypothetical protein
MMGAGAFRLIHEAAGQHGGEQGVNSAYDSDRFKNPANIREKQMRAHIQTAPPPDTY